jgi:hypothetical protein
MSTSFFPPPPIFIPPLDGDFSPAALYNRAFQAVLGEGGVPLVIGLERSPDAISTFKTSVFPEDHPYANNNFFYIERIVKFLIWQRGGYKLYVGGPRSIGEFIKIAYAPEGSRDFDQVFLSERVYEQPFQVKVCKADEVPSANEIGKKLGRHLDGCRIGFDLGASDRKVSAVIDGEVIFSEEIVWEPRIQTDPDYHYREIMAALTKASSKMERVDSIGGSSAGIYINNRPMVASLFRGIPPQRFDEIRNLFIRIRDEMGVPLIVINDGDVTALAGSMSLQWDQAKRPGMSIRMEISWDGLTSWHLHLWTIIPKPLWKSGPAILALVLDIFHNNAFSG